MKSALFLMQKKMTTMPTGVPLRPLIIQDNQVLKRKMVHRATGHLFSVLLKAWPVSAWGWMTQGSLYRSVCPASKTKNRLTDIQMNFYLFLHHFFMCNFCFCTFRNQRKHIWKDMYITLCILKVWVLTIDN